MNRSGVQLLFLFCLLWHPRVSGLRRENSFPNDGTDKRDVLLDNSENSEMGSSQLCDCCNITVVLMEERDKLDSLQQLVAHNFNLIFRQSPQFHQIFFRTVTWESFSESEMLQNPLKVTQEKVCREIMGGTSAVVLIHERPEIASVSAIAYALSFYQIPVISTSARESEFSDREVYPTFLRVLPTWKKQAKALCHLIAKFAFKQFILVHPNNTDGESFAQTLEIEAKSAKLILEATIIFSPNQLDYSNELRQLKLQKSTVILLHSNQKDAEMIFRGAVNLTLTGHDYVWLLTETALKAENLPTGVIGVTINSASEKLSLGGRIEDAFQVLAEGFKSFLHLDERGNVGLTAPNAPPSPCESWENDWTRDIGLAWNEHLLTKTSISETKSGSGPLTFDKVTNTRRGLKHFLVNLQGGLREIVGTFVRSTKHVEFNSRIFNAQFEFEEENDWGSQVNFIDHKSILWGGSSFTKPTGVKQSNHFKVVTVDERPFVEVFSPGQISALYCQPPVGSANKLCLSSHGNTFSNCTTKCIRENQNGSVDILFCCGLCIDILENLAQMANVTYDLFLSKDGTYGGRRLENESSVGYEWTGLIGELARSERDLAVAALTINSETATVIDFTKPFIYHGITILEKRRPKVSPMDSFLQPFEWPLWICILLSVSVIAITLYALDKLSPFNRYFIQQSSDDPYANEDLEQPLSFSGAMWFAWGVLLDSGIGEKTPRSLSGRVLGMVWCGFAMIIMASYTANLAAFLVLDLPEKGLTGINDPRLRNPSGNFTYATVVDSNVYQYFKQRVELSTMFRTMETRNFRTSKDAVEALRAKKLDAFIYDSFMLEYESGRDSQCQLVTTGEIFGRSAYGVGLPKGSPNTEKITQTILSMHENGTMERLDAIWLRQADKHECNQKKEKNAPAQLGLTNMRDVFILVAGGIGMGSILICFEIFICRKAKRRERQQMLAIHYARLWRAKVANTKRKRLMTGQNNETSTKSPKSFDKKKEKPSRRSGRLAADSNLRNLRNGDIEKLSIPDLKSLKFQELPDSKQNLQKVQSLKFVTPIQYNREPYQFVPVKQVLSSFHSTAKRRRSPSAESSLSSVPETDKKFFNDFSCSADKLDNQPPPPRYESMTVELWKLHRRPIQVDSEVWLGEEAEEGGFDEYSAYRPRTRIMRAGRRKGHEIEKASVGDPKSSRL